MALLRDTPPLDQISNYNHGEGEIHVMLASSFPRSPIVSSPLCQVAVCFGGLSLSYSLAGGSCAVRKRFL